MSELVVPVSFTVKTGLTFEEAVTVIDELEERFDTIHFYHTHDRGKFAIRGIIVELDSKTKEQRTVRY